MTDEPIVSTREQIGEYDAIETAKPGEPLFPLQGGDPFAPPCVQHWVDLCRAAARAEEDLDKRRDMLRKALQAEHVMWAMLSYQRGEEIDQVASADANPIADDPRLWRAGLIAGTRALHEAAHQLNNAAEYLPPDMAAQLLREIETIKRIAVAYEPKRASYGAQPDLPLGDQEIEDE